MSKIAADAFHPCGPPETYEVTVSPISDFVYVQATLLHPWPAEGGGTVLRADMLDWEGSHRYVNPPCWLFRMFGDTLDRRIERAKHAVSAWAEREIRKRRNVWSASTVRRVA